MTAEATLRQSYYPRGIIISSGEDVPKGQSLNARMVILSLNSGGVDLRRLTQAQNDAREGRLAQAMAGYVKWLAPQLDDLRKGLRVRQEKLRTEARGQLTKSHDRTPENIASLALGLEMFLRFAEDKGALTPEEREELWQGGWETLLQAGSDQGPEEESQDEAERFIELISSAISTERAYLAGTTTLAGFDPHQNRLIGWQDEAGVYLDPNAAYGMAQKLAQGEGNPLTTSRTILYRRLEQAEYLAAHDKDHSTVRRSIAGEQKRVLFLKSGALGEKSGPSGPCGPLGGDITEPPDTAAD